MKKNNKGFMLVEVIVTSTIVVTTMILLYSSFNKLSNNYKIRNSYYNLDVTYATKEVINAMISKRYGNINEFIDRVIPNSTYAYIIKEFQCVEKSNVGGGEIIIETLKSCENIKELYSVQNMIFSEYDLESLKFLNENENINQTFKEYIEYLVEYYDVNKTKDKYSYIMLTEVNVKDNYYYANLRVR